MPRSNQDDSCGGPVSKLIGMHKEVPVLYVMPPSKTDVSALRRRLCERGIYMIAEISPTVSPALDN